jgi:hypothetical protein
MIRFRLTPHVNMKTRSQDVYAWYVNSGVSAPVCSITSVMYKLQKNCIVYEIISLCKFRSKHFCFHKYLVSYARDTSKTACCSSWEVSITVWTRSKLKCIELRSKDTANIQPYPLHVGTKLTPTLSIKQFLHFICLHLYVKFSKLRGKGEKIKVSLRLIKYHVMKTYGRAEVDFHAFLTLKLNGGEWSTSRPRCFIPEERGCSTHWAAVGYVGPREEENYTALLKWNLLLAESLYWLGYPGPI